MLPLSEKDAIAGVRRCFNDWLSVRGSTSSLAQVSEVIAVRNFVLENASKFPRIPKAQKGKWTEADRLEWENIARGGSGLGFKFYETIKGKERLQYGLTAAAWKALKLTRGNTLAQLEGMGLIERGPDLKHPYQKQKRLPDGSRPWLYVVDAAVVEVSDNGQLEPETFAPQADDDDGNVVMLPPNRILHLSSREPPANQLPA